MAKGLSSSKTRKETHLLFDGSRVLQTYQANLVNNAEVMLEDPFSATERSHNLLEKSTFVISFGKSNLSNAKKFKYIERERKTNG